MIRVYFLLIFLGFTHIETSAQKITYSNYSKKETRDIYFEILGKFDSNYIVYKNIRQSHVLTQYGSDMQIIKNIPLDFVPDRTFNVDFITYKDYCLMIYQYQRNNIIYCFRTWIII